MLFARARAEKMVQVTQSLRATGTCRSNQHAVWDAVAAKAAAFSVSSPTGAMSDSYEGAEQEIGAFRGAFTAQRGQVGVVFAIDGRPVGLELFDSGDECGYRVFHHPTSACPKTGPLPNRSSSR